MRVVMKSLLLGILLVVTAGVARATPTRDEALAAIEVLEKNPISEAAIDASQIVTQFTKESEEVVITLGRDFVPWVLDERPKSDADDGVYSMLLAVYFAGNAKSQLLAKKTEDDPYSGWIAVLKAYRQIQTKYDIVIPSLEKFSEMEAQGVLKAHARELKAEEKKQERAEEKARAYRNSF